MQSASKANQVSAKVYYLAPLEEYATTKPYYVNWPVDDVPGAKQTNLEHKSYHDITIHDVRGNEESLSLDLHGFRLLKHTTALTNEAFEDDALVRLKYYPEMVDFVKSTLDASRVFIFEHTHRLQVPNTRGCGCSRKRKPLVSAHIDQTPQSSEKRVRYHLGAEADELLKRRFQVINVWRPLFGPVRDHPLTLGDAQTFDMARDGVPTDLVFPHYVGESLNLLHHGDHKWLYASDQQRDEVWIFKCFDSDQHVSQAAPHCSFDIQNEMTIERPRESIEVRMLVFY